LLGCGWRRTSPGARWRPDLRPRTWAGGLRRPEDLVAWVSRGSPVPLQAVDGYAIVTRTVTRNYGVGGGTEWLRGWVTMPEPLLDARVVCSESTQEPTATACCSASPANSHRQSSADSSASTPAPPPNGPELPAAPGPPCIRAARGAHAPLRRRPAPPGTPWPAVPGDLPQERPVLDRHRPDPRQHPGQRPPAAAHRAGHRPR